MEKPLANADDQNGLYSESVARLPAEIVEHDPCLVCRGTQVRPWVRTGSGHVVAVCLNCGLGAMSPLPKFDEIRDFYPETYYGSTGAKFSSAIEWLVWVTTAHRVRFLCHGLPAGARILDVGCGRGTLIGALADRGFETHGFELAPEAIGTADPRTEFRFGEELSDAQYEAEYFDMVVVWHVLEHLPHPEQTIAEIHRVLKPGGRLVIAVPNFSSWQSRWAGEDWFHLDLPRHLFHFPLAALRRFVEDRGFAHRSTHHFSLRQNPFGWVQSALNRLPIFRRNALYELLLRAPGGSRSLWTRLLLYGAFVLGMPIGVGFSLLATAFRQGASVHVVWTRESRSDRPRTP